MLLSVASSPKTTTSASKDIKEPCFSMSSKMISSDEAQLDECTPIKDIGFMEKNSPSHQLISKASHMLAFSTPVFDQKENRLVLASLGPNLAIKKARVNFHSIDDLASGDCKNEPNQQSSSPINNDSGITTSFMSTPNTSTWGIHSNLLSHLNSISSSYYNSSSSSSSNTSSMCKQEHQSANDSFKNDNDNSEGNDHKSLANQNEKKIRTTFTDYQKKMLDIYFNKNPYPDPKETEDLSSQLVLPESVIKVWFQNKRSRDKQRKFSLKTKNQQRFTTNENVSPVVAKCSSPKIHQSSYSSAAAIAALVASAAAHHGQYYNNFHNLY